MTMYQNGGFAIFIWNGVFQLRPNGKNKATGQQTKLYANPPTKSLGRSRESLLKMSHFQLQVCVEGLGFPSLQQKTVTRLCLGTVKELNISYLQNTSHKLLTNYFMRTMVLP